MPKRTPTLTSNRDQHIIDVDDPKFSRGDTVRIAGERGGNYRFCARRRNVNTGQEWTDVYGDSGGMRSVAPERIQKRR